MLYIMCINCNIIVITNSQHRICPICKNILYSEQSIHLTKKRARIKVIWVTTSNEFIFKKDDNTYKDVIYVKNLKPNEILLLFTRTIL